MPYGYGFSTEEHTPGDRYYITSSSLRPRRPTDLPVETGPRPAFPHTRLSQNELINPSRQTLEAFDRRVYDAAVERQRIGLDPPPLGPPPRSHPSSRYATNRFEEQQRRRHMGGTSEATYESRRPTPSEARVMRWSADVQPGAPAPPSVAASNPHRSSSRLNTLPSHHSRSTAASSLPRSSSRVHRLPSHSSQQGTAPRAEGSRYTSTYDGSGRTRRESVHESHREDSFRSRRPSYGYVRPGYW